MTVSAQAADERTLYLYYTHTRETAQITFKRNGRYVPEALQQLNVFLRDWRRSEPANMDPALFDLLWEVYQQTGSNQPIHIVSAYRAPATNAMLRASSSGVAENSQHMAGKAIDFYIPGVPISRIRDIGMVMQVGGVGYYPNSNSPFVHLDTGSVRAWPRMTTAQLRNLFPDGRTLHIGSDGTVLSQEGRRVAQAEWNSCHRIPCNAGPSLVPGATQVASTGGGGRGRTLMDVFFGNNNNDTAAQAPAPAPQPAPAPTPAPAPAAQPAPVQVAAAQPSPAPAPAAPVEAPIPPARPDAMVAVASAAPIPFQVIDADDIAPPPATEMAEAQVVQAALEAPTPLARPETLVAQAGTAAQASTTAQAGTAAQAIAALDGLPLSRPDFDEGTVLAAYAQPGAGAEAEIDDQLLTAAIPAQAASVPATSSTPGLTAEGLRAASIDPSAGLEAFAALFQGPIDAAPQGADHAAAIANAAEALAIPEGALFAPDLAAGTDMLLAAAPISGEGFGAMMAPDAGVAPTQPTQVAFSAEALAALPRFGTEDTIWVRLR